MARVSVLGVNIPEELMEIFDGHDAYELLEHIESDYGAPADNEISDAALFCVNLYAICVDHDWDHAPSSKVTVRTTLAAKKRTLTSLLEELEIDSKCKRILGENFDKWRCKNFNCSKLWDEREYLRASCKIWI